MEAMFLMHDDLLFQLLQRDSLFAALHLDDNKRNGQLLKGQPEFFDLFMFGLTFLR
jgi:hypothetical protein